MTERFARSHANAVLCSKLQTLKEGAAHQIDQHWRRVSNFLRFLSEIELPLQPAWCTCCRPHLPKVRLE